ncbi:GNAT family N-acetyltransferase [Sphingomonas sp. MA1305]|uniref:GNAT family N-acetyltransferase n=1 Tax=Sphingomonas sp. MA1305 TaxID=2479204 RepID=UPI0018DFCBE3|nr:GNAT family N-acetyltransferase [Sphingomonas sp. MA1305]MBI0476473.1 GNAT family N-acetyltransferase [Sphingomonas sp. MA1305]
MSRVAVRAYDPADRAAVLAIFDSNLPEYFGAGDREWLEETLDDPDGPAFVVTVDGAAAAFGGYELWEHYNKALLYWGMASRRFHRAGLGRLLLFARLAHAAQAAEPATRWVTVDTSPRVAPFFERCGFETTAVWPQGYRSGMTMHELRFDLAATTAAALVAACDAALAAAERHVADL